MTKKLKKQHEEVAIKVENLSKTFRIPHEKESTLKGTAVNLLNPKVKGYEVFNALEDINFEVKKGEFFGIIGRNGCGKSTLLKILAGIYIPDKNKGKVSIVGKLSPFLELGVGFNGELTGRENIFLGGTILGLANRQIAERYDKIVAFAELEDFIDMKLKNYSSGMQVRLAFALAINVEAEILLMDEVLAVGDTNFQNKCLAEFNKYKQHGKTVVLVTHDIATVQRYCDRAMLLRGGRVVRIGKASEVGDKYMHQNMSDEEKRILKEEKFSTKKDVENDVSVGKKAVEITDISFFSKAGKKKNVFETGDQLIIRAYFKKSSESGVLNFGIGLFSDENVPIFGTNTFVRKADTLVIEENGYFDLIIKSLPIKNGSYYAQAAIWGDNESKLYDHYPRSNSVRFYSKNNTAGMVELDYEWA